MRKMLAAHYRHLLHEIKERIRSAQYAALKFVNKELIDLYWDIGRMIVSRQAGNTWGKSVVERLAEDLRYEFPGIRGFSEANLWRIKSFYQIYCRDKKLAPMVREIGWSHNVLIMEKCKAMLQREFYIRMTRKFGWTKDVLIHQIGNKSYEKTLLNQTNFDKTVPKNIRSQAKLAVKDEYAFDLLELSEEHNEAQLQRTLLRRIEAFLREMGGMFAFLGSQYKVELDGQDYFIDLLLYHRGLKSLTAVELKIGDFIPEHVGKMQFYLTLLDRHVRTPGENPSIGIILCRNKRKTIVEYALWESRKPIGVATYTIVRHIPKQFKGQLPKPAQIARLLDGM